MTNKKLLISSIFIGIVHFIIVTISGKHIATQIGIQTSQVVSQFASSGFVKSLEASGQDPEKEAKANNEKMQAQYEKLKAQTEDIVFKLRVPIILLSLPTKVLFYPVVVNIKRAQMGKLKAKEISNQQFLSRLKIMELLANIINSLSLTIFIYLVVILYKKQKN